MRGRASTPSASTSTSTSPIPPAQACILTSAEKKLANSVSAVDRGIAGGTAKGGPTLFDAKNDGIGVSPFYDAASKLAADTQAKVDEALAAMKAGTLDDLPGRTAGRRTPSRWATEPR